MTAQRPAFDPDRIRTPTAPPLPRQVTVSQLTAAIKRTLADGLPGTIHLIGEISNFTRHTSGHLYLTLKDKGGEIRAVMWRSGAADLKFKPADGMAVIATGYVDFYENRGQCQFIIRRLEPRGTGALELAFRQLREQLEKEGLFDPRHKKPIAPYPRNIAVVTSPTGAAVRDILRTLQRRYPCVQVLVHPVKVQGEGAAAEIADAIARLNREAASLGGIDTIIVARGGGSLEELWAFNEEPVARAIHASRIPIISGVGHEVDITIADLVADLRAATPTAAAELAVPVRSELLAGLDECQARLHRAMRNRLELSRSKVDAIGRVSWMRDPGSLIQEAEQRLDDATSRLQAAIGRLIDRQRSRLHQLEVNLAAGRPQTVLHRQLQQLEHLASRLQWSQSQSLLAHDRRLHATEVRLAGVRPQAMLRQAHDRLATTASRLDRAARLHTRQLANRIDEKERALRATSPVRQVATENERLRKLELELTRSLAHRLKPAWQSLQSLVSRLEATSHHKTLARGFTITRDRRDGRIVTAADQVQPGQEVVTETADGEFASRVTD
ncbi:MAG: exodeoxyribonuclease VII large subunit [Phycisphaerae bacterium]|nr:exodeoxyribonuclease VII large subunit [Phycisphaerae bacterium]